VVEVCASAVVLCGVTFRFSLQFKAWSGWGVPARRLLRPELSMGPFYVTQSNPAHRLVDPTQPNPIKILKSRPTQWNGAVL